MHRMHLHVHLFNSTCSGCCLGNKFVNVIVSSISSSGVLCVKPDKTVLYAWAIDPSVVSGCRCE